MPQALPIIRKRKPQLVVMRHSGYKGAVSRRQDSGRSRRYDNLFLCDMPQVLPIIRKRKPQLVVLPHSGYKGAVSERQDPGRSSRCDKPFLYAICRRHYPLLENGSHNWLFCRIAAIREQSPRDKIPGEAVGVITFFMRYAVGITHY